MNKKNLIIIVLIIIILCLLAVWIWWPKPAGTSNSASTNNPVVSDSCGDAFDAGFKKAVADNNPNFCLTFDLNSINQYKNLEGYDYCLVPQAGEFNNSSANGLSKGDIGGCLKIFALQTHNSQACNLISISFQKDSCFLTLANRTGDKSYCNSIQDSTAGQACLSR